jgi:hypothetical protein
VRTPLFFFSRASARTTTDFFKSAQHFLSTFSANLH